jgi:pyruvate kinase
MEPFIASTHVGQQASARNLVDYLGLRQLDLRELQDRLAHMGLSSLGRSEGQVLPALDAVLGLLDRFLGFAPGGTPALAPQRGAMAEGERRLANQADELLGPEPESHATRIMVTLDRAVLEQPELIRGLIESGMNCARINCAHDDAATWAELARRVRGEAAALGRVCRVDMDLPGPKLLVRHDFPVH